MNLWLSFTFQFCLLDLPIAKENGVGVSPLTGNQQLSLGCTDVNLFDLTCSASGSPWCSLDASERVVVLSRMVVHDDRLVVHEPFEIRYEFDVGWRVVTWHIAGTTARTLFDGEKTKGGAKVRRCCSSNLNVIIKNK